MIDFHLRAAGEADLVAGLPLLPGTDRAAILSGASVHAVAPATPGRVFA